MTTTHRTMECAVNFVRSIWDKCDIGPSKDGWWCCIMHEEKAKQLIELISRVEYDRNG